MDGKKALTVHVESPTEAEAKGRDGPGSPPPLVLDRSLVREFDAVLERLEGVCDMDRLIPPEKKKLVSAVLSYRSTVSKSSGEASVDQTNPFQLKERWTYHRFFDNDLYVGLRKMYMAAIAHKYKPGGKHSCFHLVRDSGLFRDLLAINCDSAEVETPMVYRKLNDSAALSALDISLPISLSNPGSPHVIVDLGVLGKGVVDATLSSYRGLARMHGEAKLSLCCSASVCRQQLYICDTHSQEVAKLVNGISTSGVKPDFYECKENALDILSIRQLAEYFPLSVPPISPPPISLPTASPRGTFASPRSIHHSPLLHTLTDLMLERDCQRFFSCGVTSEHAHVRFFSESFRRMIFELRRQRVEEAFGGGDDGLAQFLSKTLGSMLRLMRAMTEGGGDDMAAYMDMAQGLKAEINILSLMCPNQYNDEDWSTAQDQLIPQLCYLHAGVSWPRYYFDASGGFASAVCILTSLWRQRGRRELCIGFNYLSYFEFLLRYPARMVHQYNAQKETFDRPVPPRGLDLFVVEPHRNYSNLMVEGHYVPEDVVTQVESFYEQGIVSDKFTIIIDNTIDYIASDVVFDFVQHFSCKISNGKMCVIALRSAQKYDMIGLDDFSGGICTVFCTDANCFDEDDLGRVHRGCIGRPCFQGVTFYQIACRDQQDRYRRTIFMNNHMCNQALRRELGTRVSLVEYDQFPLKITLADDDTLCCIDFRANSEDVIKDFAETLHDAGIPCQMRPNFGFAIANWFIWTDFDPPRSFGRLSMGFSTSRDLRTLCDSWVAFNRARISPKHPDKKPPMILNMRKSPVGASAQQSLF